MTDLTADFYNELADDYHLIFQDWRRGVARQGEILDRLIRQQLPAAAPRTLLDCSCGIGTQAIGLAAQGYRVHATDLSAVAVGRAQREAAAAGVVMTFGVSDFRALADEVPGRFDVVISCDNSLPHLLSEDDARLAAGNMWQKVNPGGLLLISIRDYDQLLSQMPRATLPVVYDNAEGQRIVFQVWHWHEDGRTYTLSHFILRQNGEKWETSQRTAVYRAIRRVELTAILADVGFTNIKWHMPDESDYYQPLVTAHKLPEGQGDRVIG